LIKENQKSLNDLGVSCSSIEDISEILNNYGFASKLTGAGGGGCAIAFKKNEIPNNKEGMPKELVKKGYVLY